MITAELLKQALPKIFGVDEKYLKPLSEHAFVPTLDENEKVGDWIGYRVLDKKRYARAEVVGNSEVYVPCEVTFRLSFVGPHSEELCQTVLLWDDRKDVAELFAKLMDAQIKYNRREIYSYAIKNQGFNDMPAWICDIPAETSLRLGLTEPLLPWIPGYPPMGGLVISK